MKKFWMMMLATTLFLAACEKHDDDVRHLPREVQEALNSRYPDALVYEWEMRGGYYVAEFVLPGSQYPADNEAWFDARGGWLKTEYDIHYTALPDAVRQAFEASEYGRYRVEDVELVERAEGITYLIETEVHDRDTYLCYDATGQLL